MSNKKTTVEQAYLERAQVLKETEGAPESSRVALSAISGRNVLKTKKETAKIERDKQNALLQQQAMMKQGEANSALTMAKGKLSNAVQEDHQRRSEALTFLKMGVYDHSIPNTLGLSEGVVRSFADKRSAEIEEAIAKRKAAEAAEADYEAALNKYSNGDTEKTTYADLTEEEKKAIQGSFDSDGASTDLGVSKNNALKNAGVEPNLIDVVKSLNASVGMSGETEEQQDESSDAVKLSIKKKNQAQAYYDYAMSKRIIEKETSGQGFSALETAYKESALGKVYIAKEKINSALTLEEQRTAYQNFADQITASYKDIAGRSSKILTSAGDRYDAGENLDEKELKNIQNIRDELDGLRAVLQDAISSGILTPESEQGYRDGISNIEKVITSLEAIELYSLNYNEDDAKYRVMDAQYGERTLEELEAEADRLEQELSQEYDVEVNPTSEVSRAKGMMAKINKENDPQYETLQNLQKYIERRKTTKETNEENHKAIVLSSVFDGTTDVERISNAIDSVGADIDEYNQYNEFKYMNEALLYSLYETKKPEWLGAEVVSETGGHYGYTGKQYRFYFNASNGEKWQHSLDYNQDGKFISVQDVEKRHKDNLEKQRILTNAYHRLSEDVAVGTLDGKDVDNLVTEFVANYDAKEFRNLGGKKDKYAHGDEYKSKGWFSRFYTDVDRFVKGEYGWFSKKDANTVLALLQNAGEDETKQDIAFSYYTKALERARLNEAGELGGGKWTVGIMSGISEFLANGVFMLDNAMTGDYSRVQKTLVSAAHQLTMEEFSQKTGILDDSLEFLYQAGYTVVDMVPVVALGSIPVVGQVAGSGYLYAKSLATTYDTSIRNGKRADEAFTYATLTAASEVLLEKAFSGIKGVGGSKSLGNRFSKAIEELSTTQGMKTALKLFGKMGSEGFEEFLQEVLSPFLEKVAADVNGMTDAELGEVDWEEAVKSFLLGAITGGVFSAFDVGAEYSNANQSAILSKLALQGEGKDAVKIIQMAADLGNKRAIRIKEAMKNESPIYKDQAGVRQYASEADITNLRKSIRNKNKKELLKNIRAELDADTARDQSENKRIFSIFKELLLNHRLDVRQTADLINDPTAQKILNRITGANVGAMMPNDAMYLARLASFTDKDGQVDIARIDALKNSFGELDYKAIEQILKYEDIVAEQRAEGNFSGVLYEDPAVQERLTEEQSEAVEEMELLSGMTGKFYLISDAYESGTYISKDVVAIRSEDVEKGAFYLLGHKAYYMMKQLNAEKADVVKNALLDEIEGMIGEQGIELEKKKLRQQGFDEAVLDDELCARMMPVVFLQGDYKIVEEIAKEDIEAANQLRSVIGSIREHLANNYVEKITEPEAVEASGIVRFEKGVKPKNKQQRLAVAFSKHIASAIGIDIVFYDSEIPGTFGANANGYFYGADNSIHLDLRKTKVDEGAIVFTLSHELVHFAQKFSAEKYNALADFLVENYGTEQLEQLIQKKMEQLKTTDRGLAKSEVVADACERMLLDSDAMIKLQELKKRDQGLLETIKQHIQALLDKVRVMLANIKPTSPEGVALQQMTDVLEQAHAMFEDMVVDAANTYQQTGGETLVDENIRFQIKYDEDGSYVWIESGLSNKKIKNQEEIKRYIISSIGNFYTIIESGQKVYLGKDLPGEYTHSKYTDFIKNNDPSTLRAKNKAASNLGELIEISTKKEWRPATHTHNKDAKYGVYKYFTKFAFPIKDRRGNVTNVKCYDAELVIINSSDGKKYLYDMIEIKKDTAKAVNLLKKIRNGGNNATPRGNVSKTNISNSSQNVNHPKQKKQNIFSTKTFSESMADMVSQETTELYDRLSEAVKDHYAAERAVGTERDPSAIFDGDEFTYADGDRIAEENDGATWVKEFENMSPHEREVAIARQRADVDDLLALLQETERRIEAEDHTADEELVTTDTSETKKSIGESVSESWNFIRRKVTDVGATVYDIAKKTKDWKLYHYFNYARSSSNTAIKMVEDKQTDIAGNVVGKGLNEIFKPIMDRGAIFYRDFQLYLFHMHNVDRMSRESQQNIEAANDAFGFVVDMYPELRKYSEREILEISRDIDHPDNMGAVDYITALRNKEYWSNLQNKPIFGYKVTAETSKGKAEDLLRRYPEFKELAKEVYQYSDNLMQYRVDSGLITKEFAAKLKEIYPHYVPTARVEGGSADAINAVSVGNKAIIGKTVGRAQGGDAMLIPLHKQFADQTMAVVREGSKNRFGSMLLDMAFDDAVPQVRKIEKTADRMSGIVSFDGQIDTVDPFKTEEFENIFVVYKDGEQYFMEVTPDLYEAAKALSPDKEETNKVTSTARKANDLYKRLITGYNPAFAIRNFSRDIQDALLYTKDLKGFIQNYPLAWKEIVSNGEYWKKYQALGGTYSSVFDYKSGKVQKGKPIASQIEAVNMAIEQVARLAEFMSTVKKGDGGMDNLMEAMYNAAEITTNFGRSGTVGGFLNKNFVPFLNPSIQGFSKICRTLTETKGFRPWFFLVTKAAFLGWAIPSVLNGLLWGDDDEWDLIKQRDKDLNYLFKVKDGVWLKVPKGRVLSVLGMAGHRIQQEIQGEDADWGEFIATASSQVSPTNPLTNNIVTPFVGVVSNRNWYGGEIVGQSLQNLPKAEQYDAKTDVISIWLGEVLNVSPKKINYLLDQYTGVIGDIVLPALSVASERGFWENAFTIDSDFSNRLSSDFYDQLQELTEKKNSVSGTAEDAAKYRWWNRKAGELSEVNKKINEVQADSSLTKKEKEDELKLLYASRNAVILEAEEEAETYFGAVEDIADGMDLSSDDAADVLYREANRKAFGAEEALKMYNKDTYERAVKVRDEMGIDFDTFYNVYFDDSVSNDQMFKMLQSGMDYDGAAEISKKLNVLEPEDGAQSVSYMQKYEAIAEADVSDETKLAAMKLFATDADRRRVTIGNEYGITLDQFINVKSNIEALNEMEGKTTASNARIEAAVRHQSGLTDKQRAVLWQVFTSSDSAKKNPFSIAVGAETLKKIEEAKVKEE